MSQHDDVLLGALDIHSVGAWGPGFSDWPELRNRLAEGMPLSDPAKAPKPSVIPANERRRAPLPVKAAVEVSQQAVEQSEFSSEDLACIFGSGLGDTEITDYMCRTLHTQPTALSPTKFHNSVHNAAAGYWTISSDCMQAANSIAGYHDTVGLALLEAATQAIYENQGVLVTLFDTPAYGAYRDIFSCDTGFAAALVLAPTMLKPQASRLGSLRFSTSVSNHSHTSSAKLEGLNSNPCASLLDVLTALAKRQSAHCIFSTGRGCQLVCELSIGEPSP